MNKYTISKNSNFIANASDESIPIFEKIGKPIYQ